MAGFCLTWASNICQSLQNIYIARLNERNVITPFGKYFSPRLTLSDLTLLNIEINFYFACVGLCLMTIYNFIITDNYQQLIVLLQEDQGASQAATALFLTSGLLSITITLSMLSVVILAGPIMINVVANIRDILLTYAGFAFFQDQSCTRLVLVGLTISFGGAFHALLTKFKQLKQEKQSAKSEAKTK